MIIYDRLWETMAKKGVSQYSLIKDYHVNEAQLHRLRKNMVVKTTTLDRLCEILDCDVEDICQYVKVKVRLNKDRLLLVRKQTAFFLPLRLPACQLPVRIELPA